VFLEIVCRLRGIEDNGSVEEGEKDDQPNIGDHIERAAVAEIGGDGGENSGAALASARNWRSWTGKSKSEDAKIGGMTPDVLSFNGRKDVWPS